MGKHNKNKFAQKKPMSGGIVKQKAQHQPKEVREVKAQQKAQQKGQQKGQQKEQKSPGKNKGSPQVPVAQKKNDAVQKKAGLTVQNGQDKLGKNFKPGKASSKTGKTVVFNPKVHVFNPKNKKDQKKAKKVESSDDEDEDEELDELSAEDEEDMEGIEDSDLELEEDEDVEEEAENDEEMEVTPKKAAKEQKVKASGDAPKAAKESEPKKEVKATKRSASESSSGTLSSCVAKDNLDKTLLKEMRRRDLDLQNRSLFLMIPGQSRAVSNSQIHGLHPDIIFVHRLGQTAFLRFLTTELRDKAFPALKTAHLNKKPAIIRCCGDKAEKKRSGLDKYPYFELTKLIVGDIPYNIQADKIDVIFPKATSITFNDRKTRAYVLFSNEEDGIEAFRQSKSLKFDGVPATVSFYGITAEEKSKHANQADAKKSKVEAKPEKPVKVGKKAAEAMEVDEDDDDEGGEDFDDEEVEFEDDDDDDEEDEE